MANFIGLVYATLKNEGVDTSGMNTDEAVAKYNELQKKSGGKAGEKEGTPAENRKMGMDKEEDVKTKNATKNGADYKKVISYEDNQEIDWDLAEKNEKVNGVKAKNSNRTDKYGNQLLSDEAMNVGIEAGKDYLNYMTKYYDIKTLKKSNVFLGGLSEVIGNAITNNGYNPNQDMTYQDINEIVGNILGEEVDYNAYETNKTKGFTGNKYSGYTPKK